MLFRLDFQSAVPIYRQIRDQVVLAVAQGELTPGERLPTTRALAEDAAQETFVRAVLGLPGKYREVVVLYYYQDCSTAEIAQALDLPQGTVSIRLKRARERLKPALKEWYYADVHTA